MYNAYALNDALVPSPDHALLEAIGSLTGGLQPLLVS